MTLFSVLFIAAAVVFGLISAVRLIIFFVVAKDMPEILFLAAGILLVVLYKSLTRDKSLDGRD